MFLLGRRLCNQNKDTVFKYIGRNTASSSGKLKEKEKENEDEPKNVVKKEEKDTDEIVYSLFKGPKFLKPKKEQVERIQKLAQSLLTYKQIYELPRMKYIAPLHRVKTSFQWFTGSGVAVVVALGGLDMISPSKIFAILLAYGLISILLIICTRFTRNMVGRIYLNEDLSQIRFAYLDGEAKRMDKIVNPFEVECINTRHSLYKILKFNDGTVLKINLKHGDYDEVLHEYITNFKNIPNN